MYRVTLMSGRWLAMELDSDNTTELFSDVFSDDAENIISLVDEGYPTIIVNELEDLPETMNVEEV